VIWTQSDANPFSAFTFLSPGPNGDGDLVHQCKGQVCVSPEALNTNYVWNSTSFSYCEDCTAQQYQNVTCTQVDLNFTVVADELCSPSNRPLSQQLCYNPDKGCYGAEGGDSDVIVLFGYVTLSRKTMIFTTLGAGAAFLVILGCCYQAVTSVPTHRLNFQPLILFPVG
jgi:hypothetical protein